MNEIIPDEFGKCIKCHKSLLENKFYGNSWHQGFSGDYTTTELLLDDGSKMKVVICQKCKESLEDKDLEGIMKSVVIGWEKELEKLNWSEERKKAYMYKYSKLEPVCVSENKPILVLDEKLNLFRDKKLKSLKEIKHAKS